MRRYTVISDTRRCSATSATVSSASRPDADVVDADVVDVGDMVAPVIVCGLPSTQAGGCDIGGILRSR